MTSARVRHHSCGSKLPITSVWGLTPTRLLRRGLTPSQELWPVVDAIEYH